MPIHDLPQHILSDILLCIVQSDIQTISEPIGEPISIDPQALSPWNLAAVSKLWRETCEDCSRLWTYITLQNHRCIIPAESKADLENLQSQGEYTCVNGLGLLRIYLQLDRSKSAPLNVHLHIPDNFSSDCARFMLTAASSHSARWGTLKINDSAAEHGIEFLHLPQLTTLSYHGMDDYLYIPQSLTSLTHVRLDEFYGRPLQGLVRTVRLPFPQLVTVSLCNYVGTISTVLEMMAACTSLHSFHLQMILEESTAPPEDIAYPQGGIVLEYLTHLEVNINGVLHEEPDTLIFNGVLPMLLPRIRAPKLSVLMLSIPTMDTPDTDVLKDFVDRSRCIITTADIHTTFRKPINNTLRSLPQVEDLKVFCNTTPSGIFLPEPLGYSCSDLTFMLVGRDGTMTNVLPKLRRLTISNLQFDPALLIRIVESRMAESQETNGQQEVVRLEELNIDYFSAQENPVLRLYRTVLWERLSKYESSGFRLRFDSARRSRIDDVFL
ncbi:hypothetical protein BDV98DRAFT_561369 [Pterulicium gracile]|uniref:F-box domain-containing protein n=1 Tax=Pterulicium gracile TaxID=1884261 RepID=A0A5C3QXC2_9AGAR|nr:hypothetical protein BDV98DRAFT_561369 [Pterula gracilis]